MEDRSPSVLSFLLAAIFVFALSWGVFQAFGVNRTLVNSVYNQPQLEGGKGIEVGVGGAPPTPTSVPCQK
jgi:hypothetical protein